MTNRRFLREIDRMALEQERDIARIDADDSLGDLGDLGLMTVDLGGWYEGLDIDDC